VNKHQILRDKLLESLRAGEFSPEHRLPSDRELAARYGVSYLTARRAVGDLVEADLLERRVGDGTYIRPHSLRQLSTTTLNLIFSESESSLAREFLRLSVEAVERRGWEARIIRIQSDHDRAAVRALSEGEMALVFADAYELRGPFEKAMRKAGWRVVLVGNQAPGEDVSAVLAADGRAIQLAIEHLAEFGHKNIAVVANHPDFSKERVQIASWRACLNGEDETRLQQRVIAVQTPRLQCPIRCTYEMVSQWLQTCDDAAHVSALLCLGDEMTLGALSACRDAGRTVPEKMSVINMNDSSLMALVQPSITCIDLNLQRHLELAFELLEAGRAGELTDKNRIRFVESSLVSRESVQRL
jgi:DNA-binding LacI/PurR family transcriptional regulator